jgi:uncharacterized membrane protein
MSVLEVVRFLAVFSTGLLAGIFFGDRMGPAYARPALPVSSLVNFQQRVHARFVKMMPILMGVAILSSAAWLGLIRSRGGSARFLFLALGTLAYISVAVITLTVNVPINHQLMTWNASSPPSDTMETWARWERAHTVRTFIAVAGFACELAALAT